MGSIGCLVLALAATSREGARLEDELARHAARWAARILSNRQVRRELEQAWERIPPSCRRRLIQRSWRCLQRMPPDCRRRAVRFTMDTLRHVPPSMRAELAAELTRRLLESRPRRPPPPPRPTPHRPL